MRKRKFLSILLALAMILTFIPSPVSAAAYSDLVGHWGAGEISKWSDMGIISGNNGVFRPDDPITRGEMATILDKIMKYQVKAENKFSDLDQNWYTDAILRANSAGVMAGSGSKVRPADYITRQEAAVMLCRALGIKAKNGNTSFSDDSYIGSWAKGYVNALVAKGYLAGVGDNSFAPAASITRASVVKLLDNAVKGIFIKSGEYTGDIDGTVIINASDVTLENMHISGSLIVAEGVGNGKVDLNNIKVDGDVIVRGGGENSVYFNSVTVDGSLVVNKVDGAVRIVATGKTSVSLVTLESGAILVTKELAGGVIEKVEIPASLISGQKIVLDGNFKTVENNAAGLDLSASGKIDSLVLNAKATVSGGASITEISVSKGMDSVVNGKTVSDSTSTAPPASSGGGGGGGNNGTRFTVTFDSNGGSLVKSISGISKGGLIRLPANPTKANATFLGWFLDDGTFLSEFTAATPITANITVYAKWSGWQEPIEVDSRFAAGYPKASVVDSGRIQLEIKLLGASTSNPMEVFMVVNSINSGCPTDATAVVHGHAGTQDEVVYADETPYITIADTNSHTLTTNVSVSDNRGIDIFFVIRDQSSTSQNPTMLTFDPAVSAELDRFEPRLEAAYMNESKNQIYIHFDESLDSNSVPDESAFTLSEGSIEKVEVNNPERNQLGRVILSIYDVAADTEALRISYNPPETGALQDEATVPNLVEAFDATAMDAKLAAKGSSISSTGKYISLNIENSLYFWDDDEGNGFDITVKYGDDEESADFIDQDFFDVNYSFRTDGSDMIYFIELHDDSIPRLNAGGKFFITLEPQADAVDFAGNAVTEVLTFEGAPRETEAGVVPTAHFDASEKVLTLFFDEDHGLADKFFAACLFQIQSEGKTYILRAFTSLDADSGTIVLSDAEHNLPFDAERFDWEGATISFSLDLHPDIQVYQRLNYDSGMPYQGFDNLAISVDAR
ncbi:hypothetical protein FRZ06_19365 [Anoxybacterium hadale]|uniref:Uncharacterized protein n=1 Tax=Anoxybacterium hadale TaxID=3408580 RepID=A0ACD1AG11_9FIRM|nr:hypothetical protein FRZ06_19365 [Clostridiales bacterium]